MIPAFVYNRRNPYGRWLILSRRHAVNQATTDINARQTLRASRDALLQRTAEEPDLTWRVLITLNASRALIAISLLVLFIAGGEPRVFGDQFPTLFWVTAAIYLFFSLFSAVALRQRWLAADIQAVSQSLFDIAAIIILMHASGGISSGLGGLLIVYVGAGSLVLPKQYPTVLAAVATFAILGQQAFSQLGDLSSVANYPAAGMLSAIIFAMALATRPLGRRIQASEALARQRGVDLQNLSELNEYIVQHLRESIIVIDAAGKIRLSNASAAQQERFAACHCAQSSNRWQTISVNGVKMPNGLRTRSSR